MEERREGGKAEQMELKPMVPSPSLNCARDEASAPEEALPVRSQRRTPFTALVHRMHLNSVDARMRTEEAQ